MPRGAVLEPLREGVPFCSPFISKVFFDLFWAI